MWATLSLISSIVAASASTVSSESRALFSSLSLRDGASFSAYHPPSSFEIYRSGVDSPLSARGEKAVDFRHAASSFVEHRLGNGTTKFRSGFEGAVSSHAYFNQHFNGIPVANAVANVAQNKAGKVTSFSTSFLRAPRKIASPHPSLTASQAAEKAASALGGAALPKAKIALKYLAISEDELVLTHAVHVQVDPLQRVLAYINAATGEVVAVVNETFDLTYRAIPITKRDPFDGFNLDVNPEDHLASPHGWITPPGGVATNATEGANVVATLYSKRQTTRLSGKDKFDYPYDMRLAPDDPKNTDAAVVNAFYILNRVHDIIYRYGFTEKTFNFQGDDPVLLQVQSTKGENNAKYMAGPDGLSPEIHLFLWTKTEPGRDSAVSVDILTHEVTHGLTDRLISGGESGCLTGTPEAAGLSEGWSDAFADWVSQTSAHIKDFAPAAYASNNTAGIRSKPYSTDKKVNDLTYELLQKAYDSHLYGELWAEVLHIVLAKLTKKHGFSNDAFVNPDATGGNVIWLHLFIDALAITPCYPTFRQARLAWIQADETRYGGKNKCLLWRAFASRGIGVNADGTYANNYDVPPECISVCKSAHSKDFL